MIYEISNDLLKVSISDVGAELLSIRSADGRERLSTADLKACPGRGSVSFPFVGKNTIGIYHYNGRAYPAEINGFLHHMKMSPICREQNRISLFLRADSKTMAVYPFDFSVTVEYFLDGRTLGVVYKVENLQDDIMYFGLSGRPCLNILSDTGKSSAFLKFPQAEKTFLYPLTKGYIWDSKVFHPLLAGNMLQLISHISNDETVIISGTGGEVQIFSPRSCHSITIKYPDMPFFAFRYSCKQDVPFINVELCTSLPSNYGIVDELNSKPDLIALAGGETYINSWDISFT